MRMLERYLEENEITQSQLAEMIGVKQPSVWEWLNGHTNPSTSSLRKLSEVTGLSLDDLLRDTTV